MPLYEPFLGPDENFLFLRLDFFFDEGRFMGFIKVVLRRIYEKKKERKYTFVFLELSSAFFEQRSTQSFNIYA